MRHSISHQLSELLSNEQEEIQKCVQEWKTWWTAVKARGYPSFGELEMHLSRILTRLRDHFDHEERSGFLARIAKEGTSDVTALDRLTQEHSDLLSRLKSLVDRLQIYTSSECSWRNACREFDGILDRLKSHEQEEHRLTQAMQAKFTMPDNPEELD